jgi:TolB-like protein
MAILWFANETPMTGDSAPNAIDLAHEASFELGELRVQPPTREVAIGERRQVLEPRVMQVFVALARRRGAVVSREDLFATCWGGRIVGDESINRCIGALRRLSETFDGFSITTVARVGYRLDAACADAGPEPSVLPAREITRSAEPLLAVLAFDNLSADPEMQFFSDGVSEEILQTVARGAELKVIGRGSSFQFRGTQKAAGHVGAALKASHVLDGSVRRSGSKVRIAANLIECAREITIWSEHLDRELSDVFALQDEIAAAVSAALKVAFAPAAQAEPIDPAAYNLYLRALEIRNRGLDESTLPAVIEQLEEATRLAPGFARAWGLLATSAAEALDYDQPTRSHAITRATVVRAAQTALTLDHDLGSAYQALGQLKPVGRFAEREALHHKAVSVAPNDPTVLTNASLFFAEVGRIDEALEFAGRAYGLDPLYPWAANWYATLLADFAGRNEEGCALWDRLRALWPDNELIAWNSIASAGAHGDWARWDDLVAAAGERKLDTPTLRVIIAYGRDRREPGPDVQARELARARGRLARTGNLPISTYSFLSTLGLNDEVFDLLDRASFASIFEDEERSPNGAFGSSGLFSPVYNPTMRRDIRFVGACAKLGLVDYWLNSGRWPDCAEEGALPYDFKSECRRLAAA